MVMITFGLVVCVLGVVFIKLFGSRYIRVYAVTNARKRQFNKAENFGYWCCVGGVILMLIGAVSRLFH